MQDEEKRTVEADHATDNEPRKTTARKPSLEVTLTTDTLVAFSSVCVNLHVQPVPLNRTRCVQ